MSSSIGEQLALLPEYLGGHLRLTLLALFLGALFSVPLGIWFSRAPRLERIVLSLVSVLQTVPGLAMLAFLVPALAFLGLPSIGFLPALIGLSIYSVLPMLRSTVVGLASLDPALREAAQGVGMNPRQQLLRVELPLALPMILSGVRTAAVWTVGTATLATPVGAPSLGGYIFSGLQTRNYVAVLTGCLASAVLALLLDGQVRGLGRRRGTATLSALSLLLLAAVAVALPAAPGWVRGASRGAAGASPPLRIGAKTFSEQYILSQILAQQIQSHTGRGVKTLESLGSTVLYDALRAGQVDAYVDYSGTLWATVMGQSGSPPPRQHVLAAVRTFCQQQGITVAAVLGFENAYALALPTREATRLGITSLSQLRAHSSTLRIGSDYELFGRPEWRRLVQVYGLQFAEQRSMDPALMYEALRTRQVDVLGAFSSDGRIASYELTVLADDQQAIPPYDALILLRPGLASQAPDVLRALAALEGRLTPTTMRRLNGQVDLQHLSPERVAREFLAGCCTPVGSQ